MEIFLKNWQERLISEISKTNRLQIISPFVSEQVLRKIENTFDFSNLELITRYNLPDFALRVSSIDGLKFSIEKGATVYGIKGLHSKIYLFDKRAAIITSANLTNGGLKNNFECGIFHTNPKVIEKLQNYFNDLKNIAKNNILSIENCNDWEVRLQGVNKPSSEVTSLPDFGASAPLIDKKRNYYVKFMGNADNRVDLNFSVKTEIEGALCHYACCFPINKKPRQVKDEDIIFMARLTKNPNDYAIFGRAIALKFVDGRDETTENEKNERPWKNRWPNYIRVKNPIFLDGTMGDCVFMQDLISKFDYDSFAATRKRYDDGDINVKPTKSLMQKAYIKLTHNSAEWLEQRFNDAINTFGQVDDEFIKSLPQSEIKI